MAEATYPVHPDSGHPPYLAHHFDTPQQQFEAGKLGMWIFLVTEILFFSGLFCAYAVYRSIHPEAFRYAHYFLDKPLGAINTVVLLFSSLTIAWAVRCAQLDQRRGLVACLAITLLCACVFLGIKYVEYHHKWEHALLPGAHYKPDVEELAKIQASIPPGHSASHSPEDLVGARPQDVATFFSIYFIMTGLHGIHVLGGMAVIGCILVAAVRGRYGREYYSPVDFTALYWHFVDLVWIFLFPLLYLIH